MHARDDVDEVEELPAARHGGGSRLFPALRAGVWVLALLVMSFGGLAGVAGVVEDGRAGKATAQTTAAVLLVAGFVGTYAMARALVFLLDEVERLVNGPRVDR